MIKRLSFKMRITLFTGIIIMITSLSLTLVSMYNARKQLITVTVSDEIPGNADSYVSYVVEDTNIYDIEGVELNEAEIAGENDSMYDDSVTTRYSVNTVRAASRRFNISSIVSMLIVTAFGMLFAYLLADKSLKPVKELNDAAMHITEKNLELRLPECEAKDEISSLTNAFNSMLDRLNGAFENQKLFSSNAAHELKTPVAVIKAGIQALEIDENSDIEDYREVFTIIRRNVNRLADIVDELLMLTNKNCSFSCSEVSVNTMLMEIADDLKPKYSDKDIRIEYKFDGEFFVRCPETLACRLFSNLIENAFKYNKSKGGYIKISVEDTDEGCAVKIIDSGIGIPASELDNIWEAFYCVDSSRSKKLGGVGLGLSLVKEIADCFKWDISVCSDETGSEFTVECIDV